MFGVQSPFLELAFHVLVILVQKYKNLDSVQENSVSDILRHNLSLYPNKKSKRRF